MSQLPYLCTIQSLKSGHLTNQDTSFCPKGVLIREASQYIHLHAHNVHVYRLAYSDVATYTEVSDMEHVLVGFIVMQCTCTCASPLVIPLRVTCSNRYKMTYTPRLLTMCSENYCTWFVCVCLSDAHFLRHSKLVHIERKVRYMYI